MKLKKEDVVNVVQTPQTIQSRLAISLREKHTQAVAANLAAAFIWTAEFDGIMDEVVAQTHGAPAAGESMTFDVLKNGVSILKSVITLDSTDTTLNDFGKIDPDKATFKAGDIFTVTRVYTAGGGPTPMTDTVVIIRPAPFGLL